MSTPGFSADWLRLREPHDRAARRDAFLALDGLGLLERWRARSADDAVFDVTDLACGSGANLRELAPRLGGRQRWQLVDHDPALLAALPSALCEWAAQQGHQLTQPAEGQWRVEGQRFSADIHPVQLDLAQELGQLNLRRTHLLTASALLDLVSLSWLEGLVDQARLAQVAVLFALNVDGRVQWYPADDGDELVHELFKLHQGCDKGFGAAMGARAPGHALRLLSAAGYDVAQSTSDWLIQGQSDPVMQIALIHGMAEAALEKSPTQGAAMQAWAQQRLARVDTSGLRIGHVDILGVPAAQMGAGLRSRSHS
jgi:hypothetical protein